MGWKSVGNSVRMRQFRRFEPRLGNLDRSTADHSVDRPGGRLMMFGILHMTRSRGGREGGGLWNGMEWTPSPLPSASSLLYERNIFFTETPQFISGPIVMFRPKLFSFRCFGNLFFGPKWHKMAEIPKPKTKLFVHCSSLASSLVPTLFKAMSERASERAACRTRCAPASLPLSPSLPHRTASLFPLPSRCSPARNRAGLAWKGTTRCHRRRRLTATLFNCAVLMLMAWHTWGKRGVAWDQPLW